MQRQPPRPGNGEQSQKVETAESLHRHTGNGRPVSDEDRPKEKNNLRGKKYENNKKITA